jgi:hypothetical protein
VLSAFDHDGRGRGAHHGAVDPDAMALSGGCEREPAARLGERRRRRSLGRSGRNRRGFFPACRGRNRARRRRRERTCARRHRGRSERPPLRRGHHLSRGSDGSVDLARRRRHVREDRRRRSARIRRRRGAGRTRGHGVRRRCCASARVFLRDEPHGGRASRERGEAQNQASRDNLGEHGSGTRRGSDIARERTCVRLGSRGVGERRGARGIRRRRGSWADGHAHRREIPGGWSVPHRYAQRSLRNEHVPRRNRRSGRKMHRRGVRSHGRGLNRHRCGVRRHRRCARREDRGGHGRRRGRARDRRERDLGGRLLEKRAGRCHRRRGRTIRARRARRRWRCTRRGCRNGLARPRRNRPRRDGRARVFRIRARRARRRRLGVHLFEHVLEHHLGGGVRAHRLSIELSENAIGRLRADRLFFQRRGHVCVRDARVAREWLGGSATRGRRTMRWSFCGSRQRPRGRARRRDFVRVRHAGKAWKRAFSR